MGRRSLGLALASLALVVPASAHAAPKAQEADPYKVLVVTSTTDALSTAGVNAITQAVGADGVVTAPRTGIEWARSSRPPGWTHTARSCS